VTSAAAAAVPAPRAALRMRALYLDEIAVRAEALTVEELAANRPLESLAGSAGRDGEYAQLFVSLKRLFTAPEWADFPEKATTAVGRAPLDFFEGILGGFSDYITDEMKGYGEVATGVGGKLSDAGKCALLSLRFPWPDPDGQGGSDPCKGMREVAESLTRATEMFERLKSVGVERLLEMGKQALELALEVVNEVMSRLTQLLAKWVDEIREWLRNLSGDARKIGGLIGTLVAALVIEWLTAGVGRAIKAARAARTLATVDVVPRVSGDDLAKKLLEELTHAVQRVLLEKKKKLNAFMTLEKDQILRKGLKPEQTRVFVKNRRRVIELLREEHKRLNGKIASYRDAKVLQVDYNQNACAAHYLEAVADNDKMDLWEVQGRRDALGNSVFEANHIFEANVFEKTKEKYRQQFERLGWNSPEDMDTIIMPGAEHTRSVRAMLKRQGFSDTEIENLAPEIPESVTTLQRRYIRTGYDPQYPDALVIGPNTKFSEILNKYEWLYKTHFPHQWERPGEAMDLKRQLKKWRDSVANLPDTLST
jgi:vacuolar-type H+-ATPase subunit E/Vma4